MSGKRIIVTSKGLYRGFLIMENGEKFIIYIGTERHEFDYLPETTKFIDDWIALKTN